MQTIRKVWVNNGVITLGFPQDIVKWLGLKEDSVLTIQDEVGKHGKYISIWIEKKEKK